jgi:hypothetical protein
MENWGEDIFKPTIWNESFHQDSNDNDVTVVNFTTSKNLAVKITAPHQTTKLEDHLLSAVRD